MHVPSRQRPWSRWVLAASIAAIASVSSCGPGDAFPTFDAITVTPADLTTAWDASIAIDLSNDHAAVRAAGDDARLARAIHCTRASDGSVVDVSLTVDGTSATRWLARPAASLAPAAWYDVSVDLSQLSVAYRETTGRALTIVHRRVYTGSLPFWRALAQWEGPDVERVEIQASEPLQLATGASLAAVVSATAGGAACALDPDYFTDLSVGRISLLCSSTSPDREVIVSVHPGLTSASGVPLRDVMANEDGRLAWVPARDGSDPAAEPSIAFFDGSIGGP